MSEENISMNDEQDSGDLHKWYVINAIVGQERKVAKTLQHEIEHRCMESLISEIIVPAEKVTEIRRSKKVSVERKACPGYIIVRMEMNDKTWQLIRSISGVTKFLEKDKKPMPVPTHEIQRMLDYLNEVSVSNQNIVDSIAYIPGDVVEIIDGAFEGFSAVVESVDNERSRMKVSVSIFGRETPIELDFKQASKS